jgi:hypothetical protein
MPEDVGRLVDPPVDLGRGVLRSFSPNSRFWRTVMCG